MEALYDLSGGSVGQWVYWQNVAPRLDWEVDDLNEALDIADYLANSGLITIEASEGTIYKITAAGIDEVEGEPASGFGVSVPNLSSSATKIEEAPLHIRDSLQRFREDHPDPAKVAFILMRFGTTTAHAAIADAVKTVLDQHGVVGLRADDKEYHDDLWPNVLTYMHGCSMGIAVFERIEEQVFNPNVSLEVGYMMASLKPLCLLKDQTLSALPADLVGKLYRQFDPHDPAGTIPAVVSKWLSDKGLGSTRA